MLGPPRRQEKLSVRTAPLRRKLRGTDITEQKASPSKSRYSQLAIPSSPFPLSHAYANSARLVMVSDLARHLLLNSTVPPIQFGSGSLPRG